MNRYQTLGPRILALLIDTIVFVPLIGLYLWLPQSGLPGWAQVVLPAISSFLSLSYTILLHWKYGQTIGKMVTKVKVVDVISEGPISFRQSCLRDIYYIASESVDLGMIIILFLAGFAWESETMLAAEGYLIWPMFIWLVVDIIVCVKSKKNRALHDFIAGTVVVRLDMRAEAGKKLEPPGPEEYAEI